MVYNMYVRYAAKRTYRWSPGLAYCIGLLASDGCLQKDGRHIDLTSVDKDQLTNFCKAMGRDFRIGTKQSGSDNQAYRIQFSDVALYDFLLDAGITPAKSHTIGPLSVPEVFYADFLRGIFDGDGTSYGYIDKRWRSSFMFYTGFASASRSFLEYLQAMNISRVGTTAGTIKAGSRAYSLTYAKADSIKLTNYMYYDPALPYLHRKKYKLDSFIRKHRTAILIASNARVVKLVNTQP